MTRVPYKLKTRVIRNDALVHDKIKYWKAVRIALCRVHLVCAIWVDMRSVLWYACIGIVGLVGSANTILYCSPRYVIAGIDTTLQCTYIGDMPSRISLRRRGSGAGISTSVQECSNISRYVANGANYTCNIVKRYNVNYMAFNISISEGWGSFGLYEVFVTRGNRDVSACIIEVRLSLSCIHLNPCTNDSVIRCTLIPKTSNASIEPEWGWLPGHDSTAHDHLRDVNGTYNIINKYMTYVLEKSDSIEYFIRIPSFKRDRVYTCNLKYTCVNPLYESLGFRMRSYQERCVLASASILVKNPHMCTYAQALDPRLSAAVVSPVAVVLCYYTLKSLYIKWRSSRTTSVPYL